MTGHNAWVLKTKSLAMLRASLSVALERLCSSSLLYPSMLDGRLMVSIFTTTAGHSLDGAPRSGSFWRAISCLLAV